MAVIKSIQNPPPNGISLETFIYPDQYVSYEEKQTKEWIKNNVDYWSSVAYAQYNGKNYITKNYQLLDGIFDFNDYQNDDEIDPFLKELQGAMDTDVPKHLKHYSIINPPLNTLLGELMNRVDNKRVKAIDLDSKNEYINAKATIIKNIIQAQIQESVKQSLEAQGIDIETEDGQNQFKQMSLSQVEDYMRKSYSDIGEEWGNKALNLAKDYFNIAEKSEDGFKDLLTCSQEYHLVEASTKNAMGVNYELLNPRNVWYLGHPNMKHTDIAYAIGYIDRYDISYILSKFDLTEEEIDHIRELQANNGYGPAYRDSLGQGKGIDSINYNTYNPAAYITNQLNPGIITPDKNDPFVNQLSTFGQYGNTAFEKFIVVRGFFISKRKIGKRSYFDEDGNLQTMIVAENYKPLLKPKFRVWVKDDEDRTTENLISGELVEWGYQNEWWEFTKIGSDIYKCNPLPYNMCPIVGIVHNNKNAAPRSLVDLMKPLQVLYNVCMNQLYDLLAKEMGVVVLQSLRHIPKFKDLGGEDALAVWEEKARAKGIIFVDDSPENLKAPSSFNQWTRIDLARTQEIQSRYNLAMQLKSECWELVGISRERLGQVAASQTATGTNAALSKSYSQTELYFKAHESVMKNVYQRILDVFKWVECNKPESIISHINSDMENIYIKLSTDVLYTKDLMLFTTDSGKDQHIFEEIRALSQPALQNGADFLDIINLYSTDSRAEMKNIFQKLKDERQQREQQAQQIEQQKLQQQQEQFQKQQELLTQQHQESIENENYNKEMDRINKKEIAIISATGYGKVSSEDADNNGIQDILELKNIENEQAKIEKDHALKLADFAHKAKQADDARKMELEKLKLEKEKLKQDKEKSIREAKLQKENMKNDEKIARINAANRKKNKK